MERNGIHVAGACEQGTLSAINRLIHFTSLMFSYAPTRPRGFVGGYWRCGEGSPFFLFECKIARVHRFVELGSPAVGEQIARMYRSKSSESGAARRMG